MSEQFREEKRSEEDNLKEAISRSKLLQQVSDMGPEGKKLAEGSIKNQQEKDANKKAKEPVERDPKARPGRKRRIIDKSEPMAG